MHNTKAEKKSFTPEEKREISSCDEEPRSRATGNHQDGMVRVGDNAPECVTKDKTKTASVDATTETAITEETIAGQSSNSG